MHVKLKPSAFKYHNETLTQCSQFFKNKIHHIKLSC